MQGMERRFVERLTIRTVLLAGFGLMLGLWLLAGYQVTQRLRGAQQDSAAVSVRYQQAQELLASMRAQVLEASVLLRDALLDPDPVAQADHRRSIEGAYAAIDRILTQYVPFLDSTAERERVGRLRQEIREFRSASDEVLATDSSRWPAEARTLLRRFMPKREAAIRVSDELQSLNRAAFIDQQRAVSEMQAAMQRQIWTVFGVALAISLAIGLLASRHATRLERRLMEQHEREERIAGDLQRLSARLVQAREDEQRRIARELHDEVGQALSAVKVQLAVAERGMAHMPGARALLADAQSSTDVALHSVRDLSHLLHPSALDDLGLVAALDSHVADFRRRHRIAVEFQHEGHERRLQPETERAVYRIVQEGLTNITKHAGATAGTVWLTTDPESVTVAIEDNGVGFDVADVERPGKRRGLGLLSIRERVAGLGGTVRIESTAGRGSRIEVALPSVEPPRIDDLDPVLVASIMDADSEVDGG
jgi:signal transduction histidine kinase